jgi:hypothetical protein
MSISIDAISVAEEAIVSMDDRLEEGVMECISELRECASGVGAGEVCVNLARPWMWR